MKKFIQRWLNITDLFRIRNADLVENEFRHQRCVQTNDKLSKLENRLELLEYHTGFRFVNIRVPEEPYIKEIPPMKTMSVLVPYESQINDGSVILNPEK